MTFTSRFPRLLAEEAAELFSDGDTLAVGGFTIPGCPKSVPRALAARARELHRRGQPFQIRLLTGASTHPAIDEALAEAEAVSFRMPYQTSKAIRRRINENAVEYTDVHLSHVTQLLLTGVFGKIDVAVVEATEVTDDGRIYLTASIGTAPTYLQEAERVIVEINRRRSGRIREMADILVLPLPPHRRPIPITHPLEKIGRPFVQVDPEKIVGLIETDEPDQAPPFRDPDAISGRIAGHVIRFLLDEMRAGRIPPEFLPLQSGVGNVANAVMHGLGSHPDIPPFRMYTEVYQDQCVELMRSGRLLGASATSLTLSEERLESVEADMDFFAPRIVLRPQEISNNPIIIRQLGVIAMNTALEVDIYGNVNSTHVCGMHLMNGIGGSADFTRNAYISIFFCPSFARGGRVSTIVPMASHVDHSEHSVQVIVTEHGLADLRGLGPEQRARRIIDHCAHPAYRPYLRDYLQSAPPGHIRHDLCRCFEMHCNLREEGAMLPDLDFSQFEPSCE